MGTAPNPTVRLRRLGSELRRLREAAGLTLEQAGARLERTPSSLSKIETGRVNIRPRDLRVVLDMYEVDEAAKRETLLGLARDGRKREWWQPYRDALSSPYLDFITLEADAVGIRTFETLLIPGLLQTEGYARAVISAVPPAPGPERDIDQLVAVRMARQEILTKPQPLHLWAILGEAALRQQVGGRNEMGAQVRRLIGAAQLDNVTLQILPYTVGAHAGINGAFTVLEFPEPSDLDVVLVENLTSRLFLEQAEDVRRYSTVFDHLRASAMAPGASLELLGEIAEEP